MSPNHEESVDCIDLGFRPDLEEAIELFVCNLDWRFLPFRYGDVYKFDKMLIDRHQSMLCHDVELITGHNIQEIHDVKNEVIEYFTHHYHKLCTCTIPNLTIATSDRVTCHTERQSDCAETQTITKEDVVFIFEMTAANMIKRIKIRSITRTQAGT